MSQSTDWRPARMRSKSPSFWAVAARTSAVAQWSASLMAGSLMWTPSSTPIARQCLIVSRKLSGPRLTTVIVESGWLSLMRSAASTAMVSNWLGTGCTPGAGTTFLSASSTLNCEAGVSGSGTCLAKQMMRSQAKQSVLASVKQRRDAGNVEPGAVRDVFSEPFVDQLL